MTSPLSIVWCAPIYEASGYADEARGMLTALEAARVPVVLRPVLERQIAGFRAQLAPQVAAALTAQEQRAPVSPFLLVEHFLADGFVAAPSAAAVVGRTMFETDALPPAWVERCNALDAIWVPSQFNVESFRRAGVRVPLHIVPGGVDCTQYTPEGPALPIDGARGTVFLSVFEWRRRKGWDVLLRAWVNAFTAHDHVSLVLRTFVPGQSAAADSASAIERSIDEFLASECGTSRERVAPIIVVPGLIPESEMPSLYRAAHVYVSPTRGEGWGRPFMEAMATALPVITTRWSAHLDYMNDNNSLLIDVDGLVPAVDPELSVYRGTSWAEPSVSHLTQLLRVPIDDPDRARAIGTRARDDMRAHWRWSRAAFAITHGVQEVVHRRTASQERVSELRASHALRTVLIDAPVFDPVHASRALTDWLDPWQRALASLGATVRVIGRANDARPSLASPTEPYWHDRLVPTTAEPHVSPSATLSWCTSNSTVRMHPPARGAWIVCTGDRVFDVVPDDLAADIRARADDVWVPHAVAEAAVLAIGVSATHVFRLPDARALDGATVASMQSRAGRALHERRTVLLPVSSLADVATAELVVRLWPRVCGPNAALEIRISRTAEPAVLTWAEAIVSRVHTTRGLEAVSVWSDQFAPFALPALLRGVDVVLLPHHSAATFDWLAPSRDLGLALIVPDDAISREWPDDAVWRIPASPTGGMSGSALGDALKQLCTTDALHTRREAMRDTAARARSVEASAALLAERVALVLSRVGVPER